MKYYANDAVFDIKKIFVGHAKGGIYPLHPLPFVARLA
jgi:hypothetical protein